MGYILDVLGATIIGGLVILLISQFNAQVGEVSYQIFSKNFTAIEAVSLCEILEYDIAKTGYRISDPDKILVAEADDVTFLCDYDDNGTDDNVRYFVGDTSALSNTFNPNDKPLYKQYNGGAAFMMGRVTDFAFAYSDSLGNPILGLDLQSNRNKIRNITIFFRMESEEIINESYQTVEWRRMLNLKNIY